MKILFGFMFAMGIPGACAYGIYLDFGSISAAILAFMNTSFIFLILGVLFSKVEAIAKHLNVLE